MLVGKKAERRGRETTVPGVPWRFHKMSCSEPVDGCGYGLWNDDKCRCDCIPPFCYDPLFMCASAGSCPDPFAGCTVDVDCPYSVNTSSGDCSSSPTIPQGVFQVFKTRKECCESNYPHSSACGSTSSPTGRPSILSPAAFQPSTGGGSLLFDGIEEAPALDSEVPDVDESLLSIPVGPIQIGPTPEPTIYAGTDQEQADQNQGGDESSSGPSAVIGAVVSAVLIGVSFVIWRGIRRKRNGLHKGSLDGMETSDANISIDIYNMSGHGQHDSGGPVATRVRSGQQPAAQRIPPRRYVQIERSAQSLSKYPARPVPPQDPAGRHIHEEDEEEGKGYEAGQSTFHLHNSNSNLSKDTWNEPEEDNDSFGSSSDDGNVLGLLYYAGASSADESESEADRTRASRRRNRSKSRSKRGSTSRSRKSTSRRRGASTSRSRASSRRKRPKARKNVPGSRHESKHQSAPTVLDIDPVGVREDQTEHGPIFWHGQQTPAPVSASDASTIETEEVGGVDNGTVVSEEDPKKRGTAKTMTVPGR